MFAQTEASVSKRHSSLTGTVEDAVTGEPLPEMSVQAWNSKKMSIRKLITWARLIFVSFRPAHTQLPRREADLSTRR
jgi:hypothetical protein